VVLEDTFSPLSMVYSEVFKAFDEFLLCSRQEKDVVVLNGENSSSSKSWKAPSMRFFKVNWDASLNRKTDFIGLGCVIRNFEGQVLGVKCSACKVEVDPTLVEAMAALHAILFCKEAGFRNIIF